MKSSNSIQYCKMKSKKCLIIPFIGVMFYLSSCVPAKKFDDVNGRYNKCEDENSRLRAENLSLDTKNKDLQITVSDQKKRIDNLVNDTNDMGLSSRRTRDLYARLEDSYDKLIKNNDKLSSESAENNKKLLLQLETTQTELIRKEDSLKKVTADLNLKEIRLNETNSALKEREARMAELEGILSKKDSSVKALKNIVSAALLGFENNGLTVTQKNGKVYISLEEQLLFASGSIVVDKKGEDALKKLAGVLEKNTDINVLIEGHTDNVPIKGGAIKDNWDLSVERATAVVRIITASSRVAPVRLTAAGRSEYQPIDTGSTAEARKKNRRIEIILTPKLDELFQVIESN
jgi:chemotaxis protein MotB